jgi:outer membrane biosynthesis protein TonB
MNGHRSLIQGAAIHANVAATFVTQFIARPCARSGTNDPVLRSSLMPTYPAIAATAHIEGDVSASFVLDRTGTVVSVKIPSGPPLLARSTESNIRSWKFVSGSDKSALHRTFYTKFTCRISPRVLAGTALSR